MKYKRMKKFLKTITSSKTVIYLLYLFVRVYLLTIRVKIENDQKWVNEIKKGTPVLLCLFHQQFFYTVRFFRRYSDRFATCVLISQSRDGEIGALIARFSGGHTVRGSSSRGGKQAMEGMIDFLKGSGRIGMNLVDGPQGPIGGVKAGSIRIAQKANALIVPAYFTSDNIWQVNSWDEFIIPKPFSSVTLTFDNVIKADTIKTDKEFEALRVKLEQTMAPYLKRKNT